MIFLLAFRIECGILCLTLHPPFFMNTSSSSLTITATITATIAPATLGAHNSPLFTAQAEANARGISFGQSVAVAGQMEDRLAEPEYRYLIPALAKSAGGTPQAWETASWATLSSTSLLCSDFTDYLHNLEANFWDALLRDDGYYTFTQHGWSYIRELH